jgi:hypothetical protein
MLARMVARPFSALSCALALAACSAPRLPPPPPEAAAEVALDAERIRRGSPPVVVVADTERDEGRIRGAVLQRREAFQACIERVLPSNPDVTGRIELQFVVERSGLIHDAVGETTVPALRAPKECILALVRATRIEGLQRAASVRLPIEFENPLLELNLSEVTLYPQMRIDAPVSAAVAVNAGSGDLTSEEAQNVVEAQKQALLDCYTPLLRGPFRRGVPRPQGTARFEITIAPNGDIADIDRAETPDPVPAAAECMQTVLQGLRFRATGRRSVVRARFFMRPQERAAAAPSQP